MVQFGLLPTLLSLLFISAFMVVLFTHYTGMRPQEVDMLESIKIEIQPEVIIAAIKRMAKKERDSFLEDLLAVTSPEYLKSIKEARSDYKAGRVKNHKEVFGQ